jgi:hypothetical protein
MTLLSRFTAWLALRAGLLAAVPASAQKFDALEGYAIWARSMDPILRKLLAQ